MANLESYGKYHNEFILSTIIKPYLSYSKCKIGFMQNNTFQRINYKDYKQILSMRQKYILLSLLF